MDPEYFIARAKRIDERYEELYATGYIVMRKFSDNNIPMVYHKNTREEAVALVTELLDNENTARVYFYKIEPKPSVTFY